MAFAFSGATSEDDLVVAKYGLPLTDLSPSGSR
jgi:hypothetical protein